MIFPGAGSLADTENPLRHGKLAYAISIPDITGMNSENGDYDGTHSDC